MYYLNNENDKVYFVFNIKNILLFIQLLDIRRYLLHVYVIKLSINYGQ